MGWIGKRGREVQASLFTCLFNPNIIVLGDAGNGNAKKVLHYADVAMGPLGWTATIDLSKLGLGGGGSLELTDGTTDLTGVAKITVTGAVVGGTSPNATLLISAGAAQGFVLISDAGDYYNCHTFDGVTTGGPTIKVAKHQELRCIASGSGGGATASKAIRGVTYTYTYTVRTVSGTDVEYKRSVSGSDGTSEDNWVTPALNPGEIIYAIPASFAGPSTLTSVQWLALADGRAWSK